MKRFFSMLVGFFFTILAGCHGPPTGVSAVGGSSGELVKSVYSVQADSAGAVEFQIPDHDPATGLPLVQTYEADTESKFRHVLLEHVPHVLDGRGVVYVETDPGGWVVVVAVR
jgi:hypothetical protein